MYELQMISNRRDKELQWSVLFFSKCVMELSKMENQKEKYDS